MNTKAFTLAKIRPDLLKKGFSVPVGNGYYSLPEPLPCRYINEGEDSEQFQVHHKGEWKLSESIDFVFEESPLEQLLNIELEAKINDVFNFSHEFVGTKTGDISPEQVMKLEDIKTQLKRLIVTQTLQNL